MNCFETGHLLSAHTDGELEPALARAVEEHLAGCARCRGSADSLQTLRQAVALACGTDAAPARLRSAVRSALHRQMHRPTSRRAGSAWWAAAPGLAALLLVAWLLAAQPWAGRGDAGGGTRVVYHIAGNEHVAATLRTLRNHLDAAPDARIVVVAHNNGIEFLLEGAADPEGRPYAALVRDLQARGVAFRVCTNTLSRRQIDVRRVIPEAQLVTSGIAEISRLQAREGYIYLRL